ncbi:MAG: hypothetical protein NZ555_12245 [Geminicoccaceae bacterium]|nr:hypothetical protein [Geminicoccaceae bacterium]MCX8099679.1 hypothetical protein [Geminicoccaceae bacterium]MDW8371143.1 hypothetical protein [Geminicoccaceae bacterium]
MLYLDIPTVAELRELVGERADLCVSIYLPTTPLSREARADRIALQNATREVAAGALAEGADKRRVAALEELLLDLVEDEEFWRFQAHGLAVLATPDRLRTWRLPNRLARIVERSDRFHLKPMFRATTFPYEAFVLALSANGARLLEVPRDLPPVEVSVDGMPKDAQEATRRKSIDRRSHSGRLHGEEGKKVLLEIYCRRVDAAVRAFMAGREPPLVLAATAPLDAIYRSVASTPQLVAETIPTSPETASVQELAEAARAVLDRLYAGQIRAFHALFATRAGQHRATTDIATAARAATMGAVDRLMVDIDEVVPGTVDEETGAVTFTEPSGASYGVVDEIAGRVLLTGGRVLGVRRDDLPERASLAAILRYPLG